MRHHAWFVLLVGCGGGEASGGDAGPHDAPSIDAQNDAQIDAPAPLPTHYRYVIDKLVVPQTNSEARDYALDLNSDGNPDNQLGIVIATFAAQGLGAQPGVDRVVDRGEAIHLIEFATTDLHAAVGAHFSMVGGTNAMPPPCAGPADMVCRRHLTGTASFGTSGTPDTLVGDVVLDTYLGGPGHLTMQLPLFGSPPVEITLLGARTKVSAPTANALGSIVIAGGISQTEVDTKLVPQLQGSIMAGVARDCTMLTSPPDCGCASGSTGKTLLGLFDANPKDCAVGVDEVRNNSLIQSLLAPDVTVEGQPAISLGLFATAVPAGF